MVIAVLAVMAWALRRFSLTKAVPLAISRGTTASVERLELTLDRDGLTGRGETGGFETGHRGFSTDAVERELQAVQAELEALNPEHPDAFQPLLTSLSPPAACAVALFTSTARANSASSEKPNWASTISAMKLAPPSNSTALMICTQVVARMPPNST